MALGYIPASLGEQSRCEGYGDTEVHVSHVITLPPWPIGSKLRTEAAVGRLMTPRAEAATVEPPRWSGKFSQNLYFWDGEWEDHEVRGSGCY